MAAAIPFIPAAIAAIGTVLSSRSQKKQGEQAQDAANFEADQLEESSGQQIASAQRTAIEDRHQGALAQSRALAVAAASGGGASDPTVVNIISKLAGEGAYRGMVDLYSGEEKARQMRVQADITRKGGGQAYQNAQNTSLATAISGASSLFTRYGMQSQPASANSFGLSYNPGTGYGTGGNANSFDAAGAGGWGIE